MTGQGGKSFHEKGHTQTHTTEKEGHKKDQSSHKGSDRGFAGMSEEERRPREKVVNTRW